MRLVVDASGARTGGLLTYAGALMDAWSRVSAQDDVVLLLASDVVDSMPVSVRDWAKVRTVNRTLALRGGRLNAAAEQVDKQRADVLLSLQPALPLGFVNSRVVKAIVVHDLRHELRPKEFTIQRRFVRSVIYSHAYARADLCFAISARTYSDFVRLHPSASNKTSVVLSGADHIPETLEHGTTPSRVAEAFVIAFAHHSNKRPELVINALSYLPEDLKCIIVGGSESYRSDLKRLAARLGLASRVHLPGRMPEAAYLSSLRGARAVVLASTFEGFGLPVLEAFRCGVPVAHTPEAALEEVAGGFSFVASDDSASALARAVAAACEAPAAHRREAQRRAASFAWATTAADMREQVERVVRSA